MFRDLLCVCLGLMPIALTAAAQDADDDPRRFTFTHDKVEREYHVRLPKNYDPSKSYWCLVVFHGGGGNGRNHWLVRDMYRASRKIDLPVIVISPTGSRSDPNEQRFPSLGDGEYLRHVLTDARGRYRLKPKILLTGYSRGAQFAHRFALQNPKLVHACAPLAAGSWTSPDGGFQMYAFPDKVANAAEFLGDPNNATEMPAPQRQLFVPAVAKVAGRSAVPGAKEIRFLVMCGQEDVRLPFTRSFANSLASHGYKWKPVGQ
ncbi:MAG: alpha/beta hydrolase-fold protein [Limisphaerales bacterium]